MVGMPRISCFLRGAAPCISIHTLLLIRFILFIIMLMLLIGMLIMLTIKVIISIVRTLFLVIPCI